MKNHIVNFKNLYFRFIIKIKFIRLYIYIYINLALYIAKKKVLVYKRIILFHLENIKKN